MTGKFSEIFVLDSVLKSSGVYNLLTDSALADFIAALITSRDRSDVSYLYDSISALVSGSTRETQRKATAELNDFCRRFPAYFLVITNSRFVSNISREQFENAARTNADVIFISAYPSLMPDRERVNLTENNMIAGIRRFYESGIQRAPVPNDWPHHVLIRPGVLESLNHRISLDWSEFIQSLGTFRKLSIAMGADSIDLSNDCEAASYLLANLRCANLNSDRPRISGKILLGKNVSIDESSVIAGPMIIASGCTIGKESAVCNSILEPQTHVENRETVLYKFKRKSKSASVNFANAGFRKVQSIYRQWPLFSYPRTLKRAADILFASLILILFAPVMLVISVLVVLTSRGPAFFGDKRQGLHGLNFNCYKFRSMITGADRLQQKLRKLNEVDGPQFKMEDDPRVTSIGRFLRNTYLDELPQFWNVLVGRMSVVGPRPSPESENSQCPSWRDARLSVKPGITGLWQVCRTRKSGNDFQEWVQYDKQYVSNLSLGLDLWICWKTALYICKAFLKQF